MSVYQIDPPSLSDGTISSHPIETYENEYIRRNFLVPPFVDRLWKMERWRANSNRQLGTDPFLDADSHDIKRRHELRRSRRSPHSSPASSPVSTTCTSIRSPLFMRGQEKVEIVKPSASPLFPDPRRPADRWPLRVEFHVALSDEDARYQAFLSQVGQLLHLLALSNGELSGEVCKCQIDQVSSASTESQDDLLDDDNYSMDSEDTFVDIEEMTDVEECCTKSYLSPDQTVRCGLRSVANISKIPFGSSNSEENASIFKLKSLPERYRVYDRVLVEYPAPPPFYFSYKKPWLFRDGAYRRRSSKFSRPKSMTILDFAKHIFYLYSIEDRSGHSSALTLSAAISESPGTGCLCSLCPVIGEDLATFRQGEVVWVNGRKLRRRFQLATRLAGGLYECCWPAFVLARCSRKSYLIRPIHVPEDLFGYDMSHEVDSSHIYPYASRFLSPLDSQRRIGDGWLERSLLTADSLQSSWCPGKITSLKRVSVRTKFGDDPELICLAIVNLIWLGCEAVCSGDWLRFRPGFLEDDVFLDLEAIELHIPVSGETNAMQATQAFFVGDIVRIVRSEQQSLLVPLLESQRIPLEIIEGRYIYPESMDLPDPTNSVPQRHISLDRLETFPFFAERKYSLLLDSTACLDGWLRLFTSIGHQSNQPFMEGARRHMLDRMVACRISKARMRQELESYNDETILRQPSLLVPTSQLLEGILVNTNAKPALPRRRGRPRKNTNQSSVRDDVDTASVVAATDYLDDEDPSLMGSPVAMSTLISDSEDTAILEVGRSDEFFESTVKGHESSIDMEQYDHVK